MNLRPIYYDTETTGLKPENDKIIEIAAFDPINSRTFNKLINPKIPIPKESSMICNIFDDMVKNEPGFDIIGPEFLKFCEGDVVLIAHNNDNFDKNFLIYEFKRINTLLPDFKYIDTLKWARKYRPDLPKHSLQYLREIYNVKQNNAHRAFDDVIVLREVFEQMIDDLSFEDVLKLLNEKHATKLEYMPFGKYQGKKLQEVPASYISWLKKNDVFEKSENNVLKESLEKLNLL
ncbi:MAG: DNA polymerase III subunit epsilon [Chlamydiae bacterium RIFCSPHIGHO2_12_FULL_27_8]|nr:MAG: DNA polymerase III subunit epsilon [Chlamydiae bacterium RIFCSPHIGHO2_12_FULL_27_8]